MIYFCEGEASEKLRWFETINIAGEKLTPQELKNATYSGSFVNDAKRYFSKIGCVAYSKGHRYLTGEVNRQEYLETAIKWIAKSKMKTIEQYMAEHQHDENASELWVYLKNQYGSCRKKRDATYYKQKQEITPISISYTKGKQWLKSL